MFFWFFSNTCMSFFYIFTYYTLFFLQCTFVEQNSSLADKEGYGGQAHDTADKMGSSPLRPLRFFFPPGLLTCVDVTLKEHGKMHNKDDTSANGPVNTHCEP